MLDICDDSARTLDDYQVELLRANLLDFHDCLVDEGSDIINAYDNSLIESIQLPHLHFSKHKLQQRHSTISCFSDNLLLLSSLKWLFIIARKQVEDLQNSLISFDDRSYSTF
jgi:hypothetical protein